MIAACPRCNARYRIDPGQLRSKAARLRCSQCQAVFRVRPPALEAMPPTETQEAPPRTDRPPANREKLILVADPEIETGKLTASALAGWGLTPTVVHDGVEAIMSIQRLLPSAVVIDAALPKMFGFQICELLKRNESLRHINVILVGEIHNHERYRGAPSELYGADAYIQRHQLPEGLRAILAGFGMPTATTAPPHSDPATAEAERLARIVISDIILYNQEKFDAAVRDGNVLEAMRNQLAEGQSLFAARIGSSVRDQRDFLADQLLAVARSRGVR